MNTQQMTNRERLLAALNRKETDRMPWSPLIDHYYFSSLPAQNINLTDMEVFKYLGIDIMQRHAASPKETIKNTTVRTEKNGDTTRKYLDTPVGSIYIEERATGKTNYIAKHLVESLEDIKVYTYICKNTTYTPLVNEYIEIDKQIGDDGLATLTGKVSPLQDLLQFDSGVENTVYLKLDYPEEMDELLHEMHQRNIRQYNALMEYPCPVVFDYEDTSTTVMNREMLTDNCMPHFNEYADICHNSGKLFITHMCGKLAGFADIIPLGRQDGIDSVCPPTTGDLASWDARKAFGEKVIIGGIEPPSLVWMSVEETLNTVVEIIEKLETKRSFILSTGDATPHGAPINNLLAITDLIKALGADSLKNTVDKEIVKAIINKYK